MSSEQYQRNQLHRTRSAAVGPPTSEGDTLSAAMSTEHLQRIPGLSSNMPHAAGTSETVTPTIPNDIRQRDRNTEPRTPRSECQPRSLESLSLQEKAQIGLVPQGTTRSGQQFEWDMGARNLAGRIKIGIQDSPTQFAKQNYTFSPSPQSDSTPSTMVTSTSLVSEEPSLPIIKVSPAYDGETRVFNINTPGDMSEGSDSAKPPLGTVGQFRFQVPPVEPSSDFVLTGSLGLPVPRNQQEVDDLVKMARTRPGGEEGSGGVSLKEYEERAFPATQRGEALQAALRDLVTWRSSMTGQHQYEQMMGHGAEVSAIKPHESMAARNLSDWRTPGGPGRGDGFAAFRSMEDRYKRLERS